MSQITTITCDICGKTKGPSNSWFTGASNSAELVLSFAGRKIDRPEDYRFDLCGEACALRLIQKKLEESRNAK